MKTNVVKQIAHLTVSGLAWTLFPIYVYSQRQNIIRVRAFCVI